MITQEYVNECFTYNKSTGLLTWKTRPKKHFKTPQAYGSFNARFSGSAAGTKNISDGKCRLTIQIGGKLYCVHRIIWLLVTGKLPSHLIDHIDGNSTNNKLKNLRLATPLENQRNRRLGKNNRTGVLGVRFYRGKFYSQIKVKGKQSHLGCYNDFFEAVCARKSAEISLGFHKNHGDIRPL